MQTLPLVGMALLMSGCSPSIDPTPTEVFMAMNNALCRTRDATVMLEYVTAASKPIVENLILPVQQIAKTLPVDVIFEQGCVGEKANLQVLREITDRQVAAITYLEGKDIKSMRLLRENGAWKINLTPPAGSFPGVHGAIPIPSLTSYRTSVQI